MLATKVNETASWSEHESPQVLTDIFLDSKSVVIWNRPPKESISHYFSKVFSSLGMGINGIYSIETMKHELQKSLPDCTGIDDVIEDIHLLSDMVTCLFNCQHVGMRLVPLKSAMCPSFHMDNIPVRLVNTYLGSGTEWLPVETLCPPPANKQLKQTKFGMYYDENHIQQMNEFDVGLLKGKAWQDHEELAAVHRSCQLQTDEARVLLTLDPM
ncbi:DUF1826 domain-containing protein [Paraglaciecola sp. 2405UD69-4]|uniref:DUF1826 domain-containing protein n=1 Tax=Paraglaciecola sp. 2405UD69-4 TaxID=3391836 RepID=UPI0039C942D3